MDISLQQLRMLREVAERSTIAAAAESLAFTPSAVSQQLSNLEKATGVAVLERVGRNVQLTDAGRELVRHADALLTQMEAARAALEVVANEVRGELTISVYESVAATLLRPLLTTVADLHPDLVIRTRQLDPDDAVVALARGDIDLAFTIDYPHAPSSVRDDVVRDDLLVDPFFAVVPTDDPITGPSVPLADLADRRFIASPRTASCGRCVLAACRSVGFEPDVHHEVDDYQTMMRLAAAGAGVAMVSSLGLRAPVEGVRAIELTPGFSRVVQLAYRATSADRPAIAEIRRIAGDVASAGASPQ